MNYEETLEYLYSQLPVYEKIGERAYKEGLDNSLKLDELFSHPHKKYKTIHVAGTNGKGSVSHTLAAILQQSRYKVGLFTSPHLIDFRERIKVNGKEIPEEYVVDFVATHKDQFEPVHPSFFELTMMMAFQYFADSKVDIAIIEVGLGGRLDSTNIITPDLSIITNISKDHTQFLGDTLEDIAIEKAGIMKKDIPVIIGEAGDDLRTVFTQVAEIVEAPIIFAEDENMIKSSIKTASGWLLDTRRYDQIRNQLNGYAQIKNASTILVAIMKLQKMGYSISMKAIREGFSFVSEITGLMGRWQVLQTNPRIICDTAHNIGGIKYIAEQLVHEKYDRLHFVFGMVSDKDVSSVLDLLPKDAIYYFTRASIPRAMDEKKLAQQAEEKKLLGETYSTVKNAVLSAKRAANRNDLIFIGGSNFVVAEALKLLGFPKY